MSKRKHSYVPFYMDDWAGGTARMTRPMRSVYFDVCFHNWDKVEPMSAAEQRLVFFDLPDAQGMIDMMVETGKLHSTDKGIYAPRALFEAEKAFALWERKSAGGRKDSSKSVERVLDDSEREQDQDQDQDQEQEQDQDLAQAKPTSVEPIAPGWDMIPDAWNAIAAKRGLRPVAKMTDERVKRLKARVADHGVNAILEAIETIPEAPFLMGKGERGWKAHFDWLLQPSSCAKLIEGQYHENGENDGNGSSKSGNAYVNAALEREAERAAGKH